jgi:hypothetical protein
MHLTPHETRASAGGALTSRDLARALGREPTPDGAACHPADPNAKERPREFTRRNRNRNRPLSRPVARPASADCEAAPAPMRRHLIGVAWTIAARPKRRTLVERGREGVDRSVSVRSVRPITSIFLRLWYLPQRPADLILFWCRALLLPPSRGRFQ